MSKYSFLVFLFSCYFICSAQKSSIPEKSQSKTFDTLIGPLPPLVKNKNIPYLVPSNIEVSPERTVTIEPGTIFLFKNFAGLHIRGRLIAHGNLSQPIVFTSEFDNQYNGSAPREANPFDWDGIHMTEDAFGTQLSNCSISYSVYGILSETKYIRLESLLLKENGKSVITIDNSEYQINDSSFNYILEKKDVIKDGVPIELFRDPLEKKRRILKMAGIVLFSGGIGSGIYYATEYKKATSNLSNLSNSDFNNLNLHSSKEWNDAKDDRTRNSLLCGSGILIMLAGLGCFSWTFTF